MTSLDQLGSQLSDAVRAIEQGMQQLGDRGAQQLSGPIAQTVALPNNLTGFDLVWAITQDTVNSQLEWLQLCGAIPDSVVIGDLETDGLTIGGSGEDRATIAPPTLDFDTGNARSARMQISFTGGTASHYSGFGPKAVVVKVPIAGWCVAFTVNLNLAQVAHEQLLTAGKVPEEVRKILTAFDPSMFDVQSIFLDFENSDLVNYDPGHSIIGTDDAFVKQNFATVLGAWIGSHRGQDNPFVLGYPVSRTQPSHDESSIFEPTGANLSTHAYGYPAGSTDQSRNGLSTLNFLLVTGDRTIVGDPQLSAPDAGVFHRNLLEDPSIDGKGIVARDLFFNRYLYDLIVRPFEQSLTGLPDYVHARDDRAPDVTVNNKSGMGATTPGRASFVPSATGWVYTDDVHLAWHESGFFSHDRESNQTLNFKIDVGTAQDAAGAPRLAVTITGSMTRYEWDQQNTDIPPFKSNVYVGKGWGQADFTWTMQLIFVAGADGKVTITKSSSQPDPAKSSGVDGAFKIGDIFADLLGLTSLSDAWQTNAGSLAIFETNVAQNLINSTGTILDNAMSRIVMPAPTTFFYKNLQLNAQGDIDIDFAYKSTTAPTPPTPAPGPQEPPASPMLMALPNTLPTDPPAAPDSASSSGTSSNASATHAIARATRAMLGREPTAEEATSWSADQGSASAPTAALVHRLLALDELKPATADDATRITLAYNGVFGRLGGGSPRSSDHWLTLLALGDHHINSDPGPGDLVATFVAMRESGYLEDPCSSPVDPARPLRVARDSSGNPLVFTVGENSQLQLFRKDPTTGWRQLALSPALPAPAHAHVQAFDVQQTPGGAISVVLAVAPRRGPATATVYLGLGLSNGLDDTGWLDAVRTMQARTDGPAGAVVSDMQFAPLDGGGSSLVLVGAAVSGVMNTYSFDAGVAGSWQQLRIPEDADRVLQYGVGRFRRPGVWTLYEVGPDRTLTFTTSPDRYGKTINIDYVGLPTSPTSFAVAGTQPALPEVYVAGDGIVVFRGSNQAPEPVLSSAKGCRLQSVRSTGLHTQVIYLDDADALHLLVREASGNWRDPQEITDDVRAVALLDESATELTAFAVTPSGALEIRTLPTPGTGGASPAALIEEVAQQPVWAEDPPSAHELDVMISATGAG
jgi:hypothetical protein